MSVRRAQDERLEGTPDGNTAITEISDVPDAPTIGTATDNTTGGSVSVTFTAAATGGTPSSYTVTSSPGSITGTGASSPVTVTGLTDGTSYTFTVTATNSTGTSAASSASNSVSPTGTAYYSIATVTVGSSSSATITFSSIPSTYTHLQLRFIARQDLATGSGGCAWKMKFNSSGSNYYGLHNIEGDGTSANAGYTSASGAYIYGATGMTRATAAANIFASGVIDLLDYKNTNKNKTIRTIGGYDLNGSGAVAFGSGLWMDTSAITQIDISPLGASDKFVQYSSFALYGIKGA